MDRQKIAFTTFIPMSAHTAAEAVNIIAAKIVPDLAIRPLELSSSENLITCRSCGCEDNKDDILKQFDLSLMKKNPNFGDESVRDDIDLNRLLGSYIPEKVNSTETSDQCIWNIYLHIYLLRPYERF